MFSMAIFFHVVAWISTLLFCLKLVLMLFGHLGDHDFDHGHDGGGYDSDHAFHILSLQSILAFLMGFGWAGKAALGEWHWGAMSSFMMATFFGLFLLLLFSFLMKLLFKLNDNKSPELRESIGAFGIVYIALSPKGEGVGQVELSFGGKMTILDSISSQKSLKEIPSGKQVRVVDVSPGKQLIVEEICDL